MKNHLKIILFLVISVFFIFLSYIQNDLSDLNSRLIHTVHKYSYIVHQDRRSEESHSSKHKLLLERSISLHKKSINKLQKIMIFITSICLLYILVIFFLKNIHIAYKIAVSMIIIYMLFFYKLGSNIY